MAGTIFSSALRKIIPLLGMLVFFGVFAQAQTTNGLMGYWALDEGSGSITYDSAGSNDGTIVGPLWGSISQCKVGRCLFFDGSNDYIGFDGFSAIPWNGLTIATWFKIDNLSNCLNNFCPIIFKDDGTQYQDQWIVHVHRSGQRERLRFELTTKVGSTTKTVPVYGNHSDIVSGQWYHAAATFDGTIMRLYLNGELVGSQDITTANGIAPYSGNGLDHVFDGWMDELRVYNRSLSQSEVQGLMGSGSFCGDGAKDSDEDCDGTDFGVYGTGVNQCDEYNSTLYSGGNLLCTASCTIDTGQCQTIPDPPDGNPSNLVANATGLSSITLFWEDHSTNENGFSLERSNDNFTFGVITNSILPNTTTFTDLELGIGTYYYRVRAFNQGGYSQYSNTASAALSGDEEEPDPNVLTLSLHQGSIPDSLKSNKVAQGIFEVKKIHSQAEGYSNASTMFVVALCRLDDPIGERAALCDGTNSYSSFLSALYTNDALHQNTFIVRNAHNFNSPYPFPQYSNNIEEGVFLSEGTTSITYTIDPRGSNLPEGRYRVIAGTGPSQYQFDPFQNGNTQSETETESADNFTYFDFSIVPKSGGGGGGGNRGGGSGPESGGTGGGETLTTTSTSTTTATASTVPTSEEKVLDIVGYSVIIPNPVIHAIYQVLGLFYTKG